MNDLTLLVHTAAEVRLSARDLLKGDFLNGIVAQLALISQFADTLKDIVLEQARIIVNLKHEDVLSAYKYKNIERNFKSGSASAAPTRSLFTLFFLSEISSR